MRRSLLLAAAAALLSAQDAELVLRTSVSYNTQRATLPLTPEQKQQAEQLSAAAREASRAGNFGDALRHLHRGTAVMHGFPWSPATELAASLEATVDDAIANRGQQLELALSPLYKPLQPASAKARVALRQLAPGVAPIWLGEPVEVSAAKLPLRWKVSLPREALGACELIVSLGDSEIGEQRKLLRKTIALRVENLEPAATALRERLRQHSHPTAAYALALYDAAERGHASPTRHDFAKLFTEAGTLLDAVAAGRDPFAGRKGDMHRAYLSTVDNTLQPYRLYIPAAYDGKQPRPLVVALHGMGGDENSLFDSYGQPSALQREAERLGFLVVCPKGRAPASMYRGAAETDVLDVVREVRREYQVDPKRIYMMGHSMGAYGTWSIAMAHPELFAALGPVAGGGNPAAMDKVKAIPQYVVHGDDDRTVPVTQSRSMVEAGRKVGAKIEYVEVPGGSHSNIVVPHIAPMFEFFAQQARE